jgi:outer membrane receptor protein involved in Fe transport
LTNAAGDPARSWGIQAIVRASTDRLTLLIGGALTWAVGPAAAVGFLPTQNDQDVLGNLFVDPNAATAARGQLFQDRSHVVKVAGIYRFPGGVRLGAILRYQDGQPFARLVIARDLTQGPTAVRSYANGGSAFTYTGTLDIRVQKVIMAGRSEVTARVDVYNLPNLRKEVSEYVVTGNMFRTPTALQPPRTALAGVRVTF